MIMNVSKNPFLPTNTVFHAIFTMQGCQSAQAAIEEYRRQQEAVRFSKQPRSEHTNSRTQRIGITQKESWKLCINSV